MNKNKLRWAIYRILVKERKVLLPKRGGFSIQFLYEFLNMKYGLEAEIFMDPLTAIVEDFSYTKLSEAIASTS